MAFWLAPLRDLWRSTPVTIESAMPADAVVTRITEGIRSYQTADHLFLPRQLEVRGDCTLATLGLGVNDPMFKPNPIVFLTGEVVPTDGGSNLLGAVRCTRYIQIFTTVWLTLLFGLGMTVAVVRRSQHAGEFLVSWLRDRLGRTERG